jgi:DNA-directed RNA polymerase specialized sigma24 family protein
MKGWELTEEGLDLFLNWLSPDREQAGQKFEALRRRLITFFDARGCADAEGLADKTIDRIIGKLPSLDPSFLASFGNENTSLKDPRAAYCYRFAHYVHLEYLEKVRAEEGAPAENLSVSANIDEKERKELRLNCLERCLQTLPAEKRQLLLLYFEKEKQAKVDHRKRLAERFGYSLNALRLQIHRLTLNLYDCIVACQAQEPGT